MRWQTSTSIQLRMKWNDPKFWKLRCKWGEDTNSSLDLNSFSIFGNITTISLMLATSMIHVRTWKLGNHQGRVCLASNLLTSKKFSCSRSEETKLNPEIMTQAFNQLHHINKGVSAHSGTHYTRPIIEPFISTHNANQIKIKTSQPSPTSDIIEKLKIK